MSPSQRTKLFALRVNERTNERFLRDDELEALRHWKAKAEAYMATMQQSQFPAEFDYAYLRALVMKVLGADDEEREASDHARFSFLLSSSCRFLLWFSVPIRFAAASAFGLVWCRIRR